MVSGKISIPQLPESRAGPGSLYEFSAHKRRHSLVQWGMSWYELEVERGSNGVCVDSVHQGDQDGIKGVYHINTVDCVTQYEGVATGERISEAFLIPVLAELFDSFPFVIKGFHSDLGCAGGCESRAGWLHHNGRHERWFCRSSGIWPKEVILLT